MSKYILEIKPDYEGITKGIMILGAKEDNLFVDTIAVENLEQYTPVDVEKVYDKAYRDGYNKGIKDGKAINDKGCEGCKYQANRELTCPCSECANNYKNQWTAKSPIDDGFVRGDVVVDENGTKGIVVSNDNNEDFSLYVLFGDHRIPQNVSKTWYKKTGEHYDIDKFLDEVKGEGSK